MHSGKSENPPSNTIVPGDFSLTIRPALLRLSFLLLLASTPLLALAGTPKATLAAPPADGPMQVEFSATPVSKWTDLPMGTYRVPNSDVIISGHQKGGAAGMLFGVVGVAIQSSINARRPLAGEGSWTADSGAPLRSQVSALLKSAIHTMLQDIGSPYPRDEKSLVTVHGYFPHVNKPLQVVGYKLAEADGHMLFPPKLSTLIVFAGVNILDTASVSQKPNDPTLPGQPQTAAAPAASGADDSADVPATTDAETDAAEQAGS